jgi:hypothetical protein
LCVLLNGIIAAAFGEEGRIVTQIRFERLSANRLDRQATGGYVVIVLAHYVLKALTQHCLLLGSSFVVRFREFFLGPIVKNEE